MSFAITRAVLDRPKRTIHACEQLHENAGTIAYVCGEAGPGDIVVACVSADDVAFAGAWTVPLKELPSRLPGLERGGWTLTFSPGTPVEEVRSRSLDVADLAYRRWRALMRWSAKHT